MGWTRVFPVRRPSAIFCLTAALYAGTAHAISLTSISVRSYLGQNLVAEVDVLNISPQEEASLSVSIGAPKAFLDLNMDYSQSIGDAQVELLRRPDGTRYIKLRSARPIAEPFVDLVIEVNSSIAKIVRPYRLLLDPPPSHDGDIMAPELAQRMSGPSNTALGSSTTEITPVAPAGTAKTAGVKSPKRADENQASAPETGLNILVRRGDTAGKIANRLKPDTSSIEQMLIALLQSNTQAFIRGNVNLIQEGATLYVPPAETVDQVDAKEARTRLAAQSLAFNTLQQSGKQQLYAAKGTEYSTASPVLANPSNAKSHDEARVDALKLSKNTKVDKKEVEKLEKIAKEKNKQSELERAAELAKNIRELDALAKASSAPPLPSAGPAPQVVTAAAAVGTAPVAASLPGASSAENAASTFAGASQASPPSLPKAPLANASSVDALATPPDFLDVAMETAFDSLGAVLAALGVLAVGVGAVGWAHKRKKKKSSPDAPAPADKSAAPWANITELGDSAYGGDQVDTSLSNTKIPAENSVFAAELDPVAEADVYLAYGKDEPAEEILREGLAQDPKRVAIHVKLAEIYAARRDTANFAIHGAQVQSLAGASSVEWAQIQTLGQALEPTNPRYQATQAQAPALQTIGASLDFEDLDVSNNQAPVFAGRSPGSALGPNLDPVLSFAPGSDSASLLAKTSFPKPDAFALDTVSLDLAPDPSPKTQSIAEQLETSMELAKKFIEIGELQGARDMLSEVIRYGSDEQRSKAQTLLAKLK